MAQEYFEKRLDPLFKDILVNPPAYLAAWTDENIAAKTPRSVTFPPAPETPEDPDVNFYNKMIPGLEGDPDVKVRIYEPKVKKDGLLNGVLWLHYGGYSIGSPEHEDYECIRCVKDVDAVVVSVDYRMAPEHMAPAALRDSYAGLIWLHDHAAELGVDPERIGVTGFSAGGGLTVAVVMYARDNNGPKIKFQMPCAPTMDDRCATRSTLAYTDTHALAYEHCHNIWNQYLGEGHENKDIPNYMSPARETDYSNLPPCYAFVGDLDPHVDETTAYVSNLAKAGVPVSFSIYSGGIHGFHLANMEAPISVDAFNRMYWELKRGLEA